MTWKSEFFEKAMPKDPQNVPIFVLGNKIDLEHERSVGKDRIDNFCAQNPNYIYFPTSATDGSNVNEVFTSVAKNHLQI
jgi:GTPase SAR1 family protein